MHLWQLAHSKVGVAQVLLHLTLLLEPSQPLLQSSVHLLQRICAAACHGEEDRTTRTNTATMAAALMDDGEAILASYMLVLTDDVLDLMLPVLWPYIYTGRGRP